MTLRFLRAFVTSVYDGVSRQSSRTQSTSRVLQAFGAAIGSHLHDFDAWCAAKEEALCRARGGHSAPLIVSLLSLDHETQGRVGCMFEILHHVLHTLQSFRPPHTVAVEVPSFDFTSLAPSIVSVTVLDTLLSSVQLAGSARGDHQAAKALMDIFTRSVEPLWASVGLWLKLGMNLNDNTVRDHVPLSTVGPDAEFFLRRGDVPLGSADFWLRGYTIRRHRLSGALAEEDDDDADNASGGDSTRVHTVPEFLRLVAPDILAAGKSVGLLRALQVDDFFGDLFGDEYEWMGDWPSFRSLIRSDNAVSASPSPRSASSPLSKGTSALGSSNASDNGNESPWSPSSSLPPDAPSHRPLHSSTDPLLSVDALASLIQERVKPWCLLANSRLNRVLVVDCELWRHLGCMEDLFFMRRGDALTHFCDMIFERVRRLQSLSSHFSTDSGPRLIKRGHGRIITR